MRTDVDVLVVGAGQAGLAVSHGLVREGIEHVVLERDRVGSGWAGRWDGFCLVSPNHTIRLPGGEYRGPDPDGFLPRDAIVEHLRAYAESFAAPVVERTQVMSLRTGDDGLVADTSAGRVRARRVVVCTGAYQREHRPAFAADLERVVPVVGATEYRSPGSLPDGRVLVVGAAQSGCQIAEELSRAGRDVVLAASRAPVMPRRVAGRDIFDWAGDLGFFEHTLADMPSPAVRLAPNPIVTGAGGGHDLSLRTLAARGVELIGHVLGTDGTSVIAAEDLAECVAAGDEALAGFSSAIRELAASLGLPEPPGVEVPTADLAAAPPPRLRDLGAVVLACGFRPSYEWIDIPDVVDGMGFPLQEGGASTRVPGLSFVGVPWLRTRGSPLLLGVGDDAEAVVERLVAQ